MQLNKLILLLLFIAGISSCIEPFVPITAKYENSILIEALVTDDPEIPPSVKIVRSIPLETQDEDEEISEQKPVDNAEVFIICDDGNEYMLTNQESGAYEAVNPMFTGEEGKSYKIIIYYDGEIYESDFVELKSSPEIDSIGCEVTEKNETPDGIIDTGYTFNVSTHDDSPGPSY